MATIATKCQKTMKKSVKTQKKEMDKFQKLFTQQQTQMAQDALEAEAITEQIAADSETLEGLLATANTPGAAVTTQPAKTAGVVNNTNENGETSTVAQTTTPAVTASTTTTSSNETEITNLQSKIASNQANVYSLIANMTQTSKTTNTTLKTLRAKVKRNQVASKKAVSDEKKANSTANGILKISKTTSTIGLGVTAVGFAGILVGKAMMATGFGTAAGAAIVAACKTTICPVGEYTTAAGKLGETGSYIAMGNTKMAIISGVEAVAAGVLATGVIGGASKAASQSDKIFDIIETKTADVTGACLA